MEHTVRSFSSEHNTTVQAVYRHLNNLKKDPEYADHIHKKTGTTYFDDTVAHEIEHRMTKTAIAVIDTETQSELAAANARIIDLQNDYTEALKRLNDIQSKLLESQNKILLLSDSENQRAILQEKLNQSEQKLENEKQRSELLQDQLERKERELQRPLTVRERITGRRKQNIDGDKNKND